MRKIKKLKPRERNGLWFDYPSNEKLMDKINELIDIIERQQEEINYLDKVLRRNSIYYD